MKAQAKDLSSSAFPPGTTPKQFSKSHELLKSKLDPTKQYPISLRNCGHEDIKQLQSLQRQWFPLNYSNDFYYKILRGEAWCILAEIVLEEVVGEGGEEEESKKNDEVKVIVGAVVFEFTDNFRLLDASLYTQYLSSSHTAIYIMTLGVVDEFRSRGLASRLLQQIFTYAEKNKNIQLLYLHVVSYNETALKFYHKNHFQILDTMPNFYHILEKEYEGKCVGKLVNGGTRREGWCSWFKRVVWGA